MSDEKALFLLSLSLSFVSNEPSIEHWQHTRVHQHSLEQQFEHVREFNHNAYHCECWRKDKDAKQKDSSSYFVVLSSKSFENVFNKNATVKQREKTVTPV